MSLGVYAIILLIYDQSRRFSNRFVFCIQLPFLCVLSADQIQEGVREQFCMEIEFQLSSQI